MHVAGPCLWSFLTYYVFSVVIDVLFSQFIMV